jgi:uncharacterized protein
VIDSQVLFWSVALFATFLVGASKGGLPLVGVLSVPVLSLVMSPVMAAGLLLPLYIISDVYGLWLYRKHYSLLNMKILLPALTVGILIGWAAATHTNEHVVKLFVATIGLLYCLDAILKSRRGEVAAKPADIPRGAFWGTIAGFTSFVSHSGGPPYQMYVLPQKLDKMTYAGTTTILFAIVNLLKVPPYWMLGQINVGSLETCVLLAPMSLVGAFAGFHATKILSEKLFFRVVELALFIVSVMLIWDVWHWYAASCGGVGAVC